MAENDSRTPGGQDRSEALRKADERNRAFIEQLMSANASVEMIGEQPAGAAPEPAPQTPAATEAPEPTAEAPAQADPLDQDAIDAMMAARMSARREAKQEADDPQQPPAAGTEEPQESPAALDQDAIDQMMAARKAQKAAAAAQTVEDEAPAAPAETDAAPGDAVEAPAVEALDQDAIDAMMTARRAQKAQAAAEKAAAEAPRQAPAPKAPAVETAEGEEIDQEVISAMLAARKGHTPAVATASAAATGVAAPAAGALGSRIKAHWFQLAMLLNMMLLVVGLAIYLTLRFVDGSPVRPAAGHAAVVQPEPDPVGAGAPQVDPQLEARRPVTWAEAETHYAEGRYEAALACYLQLLRRASGNAEQAGVVDLLRLRAGQCFDRLGRADDARAMLGVAFASESPIVQAVAGYHLGGLHARGGQYLEARRKAHQALVSLSMLGVPTPLESDCDYLAARALTEQVLWFENPDASLLPELPSSHDPFLGLAEQDLRRLLEEGRSRQGSAVLGPRVETAGRETFRVRAQDASLETLLTRLATAGAMDLQWGGVTPDVRQREVSIFYDETSPQRLVEVASGSVGLIGRLDGRRIVVEDPRGISSSEQLRQLVTAEAVAAWRRFLLRHPQDERAALGHLALGRLYESAGEAVAGMREYQLVASRHARHQAAPRALRASARLRMQLHDFAGARADLLDLLDRYPDFDAIDQMQIELADAAAQAGQLDEAIQIYRRLFHLNLSQHSRLGAALGLGRCQFQKGNYDEALTWLERYAGLTPDARGDTLAEALWLAGRAQTFRGNLEQALTLYYRALAAEPAGAMRTRVLMAMADVQLRQANYARAMAALGQLESAATLLDDEQRVEHWALQAQAFRQMGLSDRALDLLHAGAREIRDEALRARLATEVARTHIDLGEDAEAMRILAEVLPVLPAGPDARQATCDLAEVFLRQGRYEQAGALAEQLLKTHAAADLHPRARTLGISAYQATGRLTDAAALAAAPRTGGANR